MIEIKNLRKAYGSVVPLKDVSLKINDCDVISIIGPSGTGKSTLIRCINLLETPTSGQIIFNGVDITAKGADIKKARQKMGMVFQSFNLFGHLTVIENIMLAPMDILKMKKHEAYTKGMELLKQVGMADKALNYPDELSGGQKQRVAIARTLCMDPEVILLDEPTSALDPTMVSEVQSVIKDLSQSGKTMMIVTHEMNFARTISNRVLYMENGGVCEDGTPEQIFDNLKEEGTRKFIKRLKIFEAVIDSKDYNFTNFNENFYLYLLKNDVSTSDRYRAQLILEELVRELLLPRYDEPFIRIKTEYSLQEKDFYLCLTYKGEQFDIMKSDNALSLSIINGIASKIEYSFNGNDAEPNCVKVWLNQDSGKHNL